MTDSLLDGPDWLAELTDGLRAAGFELVEERRYNEPFGNYLATYRREHFHVRPVKDRDQWRIDLWDDTTPRDDRGFESITDAVRLQAVAEGETNEPLMPAADPARDADWIRSNLDLVGSLLASRATWIAIEDIRRKYAKRVFGIDVPRR